MNFFKKIYRRLSDRSITQTLVPKVTIIGDLPFKVIYPLDLLSDLNARLPSFLYKRIEVSGSQIVPYNIFTENRTFLASCYAVLIDGVYYGAVVSDNKLWACPESVYNFYKTDHVEIILHVRRKWIYEMQGWYKADDLSMEMKILQRKSIKNGECEHLIAYNLDNYPASLAKAVKYMNM